MVQVSTSITVVAPIEKVWAAMTHHEGMIDWPDFLKVEIIKKGVLHPDGVGCIRKVTAKGMVVTESITKYDAPIQMDYQVSEINLPIIHHGGTILLRESAEGTHVSWTSKFDMKSKNPLIRFIGGKLLVSKGNKGFGKVLKWVKTALEKTATAHVT